MPADAVLVSGSYHRAQTLKHAIEAAGWQVRVHMDAADALRDLRDGPYDALFCDEHLRGATVSGFLSWHERLNPGAPFYAIAAAGGELVTPMRGRPTLVLPYPLAGDAVPPPASATQVREREEERVVPLEGTTSTVPLAHLIELLGLNGGGAIVDTPAGAVHLANGRIEHASFAAVPGGDALAGIRALAQLITAEDLAFRVLPYRPPPQRSVNRPIMVALAEAAQQRDEQARNQRLLAAVREDHPQALGLAVGYPLNAVPDDVLDDGAAAHALLRRYADATKGVAAVAKPTHLALEGEGVAWALVALKNGLVLSGTTARGKSVVLLSAMVKCARALEAEGG